MNGIKCKAMLMSAVSLVALPVAAQAQTEQAVEDGLIFEEIIVTAGRREQSLQDVPASVAAIMPDEFRFKGLVQVADILQYTTGVTYNQSGRVGVGSISARGIPQSAGTPVFGIYIDDTPLSTNTSFASGSSILFDALLMDIERVELIKGPQGTLYGATSVGGMMRYISRDPALETFRASAGAELSSVKGGSTGQLYNGRISVPLIKDKLGITLSGYYQDTPGYVDYYNPSTGEIADKNVDGSKIKGYSADLLFVPTDKLEVRLKYLKQENDTQAASTVYLADKDSDEGLLGDFVDINQPSPKSIDYEVVSGTISYDFSWATLTSTTSYVKYSYGNKQDYTSVYAPLVDALDGRPAGTTTGVLFDSSVGSKKYVEEVRLTSERMGAFEWIAGLYYSDEDTFNKQILNVEPTYNLLAADFPSIYNEYAAFADVTYYINEKFDVTAGARLSKNEITLNYMTTGILVGEGNAANPKVKDTVGTYLFSARYRPMDTLSLYARVASGYRPAYSNLPVGDMLPGIVEADSTWSYEVGVKGHTPNGLLSYDMALWMIDWANFQASTVINGVSTSGNASDGLSAHGFELSTTVKPLDAFSLVANMTYSRSKLNSDEPGFGGVKGEQIPGLPKWTGSVQWNYLFDVMGGWAGNLGGGVRYTGSYKSGWGNSASIYPSTVDSRAIADLNVAVHNDLVTVNVYVTNLFDNRALLVRSDNIIDVTGTVSTGAFERPRTFGVSMKVDF